MKIGRKAKEQMQDALVVVVDKHKEPTELDFYTFVHLVDNSTRDDALKHTLPPITVHLYYNQQTTSFQLFTNSLKAAIHISDEVAHIQHDNPYRFFVLVMPAWRTTNDSVMKEVGRDYRAGDVAKLPSEKKQEVLAIYGKSKDETERLDIMYDIIRRRPGDDNSQILRFEKLDETNNTTAHWRFENVKLEEDPELKQIRSYIDEVVPRWDSKVEEFGESQRNFLAQVEKEVDSDKLHSFVMRKDVSSRTIVFMHNIKTNKPFLLRRLVIKESDVVRDNNPGYVVSSIQVSTMAYGNLVDSIVLTTTLTNEHDYDKMLSYAVNKQEVVYSLHNCDNRDGIIDVITGRGKVARELEFDRKEINIIKSVLDAFDGLDEKNLFSEVQQGKTVLNACDLDVLTRSMASMVERQKIGDIHVARTQQETDLLEINHLYQLIIGELQKPPQADEIRQTG